MDKEMKASSHIDEAFKRIKTATGVNNVQELVHKFLTREETYDELLIAVSDSEARIDHLRKQNEELRARLHELKIGADGEVTESEEITLLKKEREDIHRDDAVKRDKYYNVEIISDLIYGWARRVLPKVDEAISDKVTMTEEEINDRENKIKLFEHIADQVCNCLLYTSPSPRD